MPNAESKTIRIPAPVATPGEAVWVQNYRRSGIPEIGSVVRARWEYGFGWTYDVALDRRSAAGNRMRLYVGDDKLEPA